MLNCKRTCDCIYVSWAPVIWPVLDFEAWLTVLQEICYESIYDVTIFHQYMTPRLSV